MRGGSPPRVLDLPRLVERRDLVEAFLWDIERNPRRQVSILTGTPRASALSDQIGRPQTLLKIGGMRRSVN